MYHHLKIIIAQFHQQQQHASFRSCSRSLCQQPFLRNYKYSAADNKINNTSSYKYYIDK